LEFANETNANTRVSYPFTAINDQEIIEIGNFEGYNLLDLEAAINRFTIE
jgi:hypothetical protein